MVRAEGSPSLGLLRSFTILRGEVLGAVRLGLEALAWPLAARTRGSEREKVSSSGFEPRRRDRRVLWVTEMRIFVRKNLR